MASYGCPSFLSHHAIHTHLYPWHFTIYCSLRYRTRLLTDVITSVSLRCGQASSLVVVVSLCLAFFTLTIFLILQLT